MHGPYFNGYYYNIYTAYIWNIAVELGDLLKDTGLCPG